MIVDSSALIAILMGESDGSAFRTRIKEADVARMSTGSFVECAIVIDSKGGPRLGRKLDDLLRSGIELVEVTEEHARMARQAYRDFGKGSGHPAGLNFGDCFAYALASVTGEPLLYKGDDFSHTDLRSAV